MNGVRLFAALGVILLSGCISGPSEEVLHWSVRQEVAGAKPGGRSKGRALVVCMDGTANSPTDRTNVRRLFELVSSQGRPDILCFYDPGVGTGNYSKIFGKAAGAGHATNVRDALEFLSTHYRENDRIYLIGFSRGAFEVLDICGFLRYCGLPQSDSTTRTDEKESADAILLLWESVYEGMYGWVGATLLIG